jgi:hypothetical protein
MVRKRRQYGGFIDEDMLWPKGWPIPEPGQVVAAGVLKGFVEYVEFDVDAQRVLVYLR